MSFKAFCSGVAEDFVLLEYDAKMLGNEIPTPQGLASPKRILIPVKL